MLKNNKLNLLISIVCAIVLWAYITTVVNPETERTFQGIPVELVNIDALNDRGFTTNERASHQVDITVRGTRAEVQKLSESDFKAFADIAGYRKGTYEVPVSVNVPNNMELVQARPDSIMVVVVDLVTVFKPVRLEYAQSFERNQEPGFTQVIPEEMEVSGIAEVVDNIDYIRAIVPTGYLTEELNTFRLDVYAIDKDGNAIYSNIVRLSQSSIEAAGMLCYTKRVPLNIATIGEPNESIEVTDIYIPSFITIRGAKEAIEGITEVEGRPVDLSSITITETIIIDNSVLNLPEWVEVAEASKDLSVRIEVQGIARKEFKFTADMIDIINLIPSLSAHVNTGSVTVTVFAPRDVLSGVTEENITLYIDASEVKWSGNSIEMEIIAECDIEVKDITVEPKKVRITAIRE